MRLTFLLELGSQGNIFPLINVGKSWYLETHQKTFFLSTSKCSSCVMGRLFLHFSGTNRGYFCEPYSTSLQVIWAQSEEKEEEEETFGKKSFPAIKRPE